MLDQLASSKKIIVVTTSLSCGGITSFLIPLVNFLSNEGHDVTLAYTKDEGNFLLRLNSTIKLLQYQSLSRKQSIKAWCRHLAFYDMFRVRVRMNNQKPHQPSVQRLGYITAKYVHVTNDKFDVAISTAEGLCNAVVANIINATIKIGWVHPDMGSIGIDVKAGQKILDRLDYVVAVSEAGYNSLRTYFPKDRQKILHIENMMDVEGIKRRGEELIHDVTNLDEGINIVTVCRISNESKRLDRVIKVATILRDRQFKFRWNIIGDGPDLAMIKSLVEKYKLQDKVLLLGGRVNPLPYIKQSDCFVLTSQFEGKPVVIEEAKILHVPVIVTEYSSAKMQVTPEVGRVVPNEDGLLEIKIADLIMDMEWLNEVRRNNKLFNYSNVMSEEKINTILA